MYVTCGYGQKPIDFQLCHFQNGRLAAIWIFRFPDSNLSLDFDIKSKLQFSTLLVCMERSLLIFRDVTVKMAFWRSPNSSTLVSWIAEHIEIQEHSTKFAEKLMVVQLFYSISIATNKRTPGIFSHFQKALSKWLPGGHIDYFGIWTLNFSLALNFKPKPQ